MFTTAGETALAMSRNVAAFTWPVIGALFIGGAAAVCAVVADGSSREASTMPTMMLATTISIR